MKEISFFHRPWTIPSNFGTWQVKVTEVDSHLEVTVIVLTQSNGDHILMSLFLEVVIKQFHSGILEHNYAQKYSMLTIMLSILLHLIKVDCMLFLEIVMDSIQFGISECANRLNPLTVD